MKRSDSKSVEVSPINAAIAAKCRSKAAGTITSAAVASTTELTRMTIRYDKNSFKLR